MIFYRGKGEELHNGYKVFILQDAKCSGDWLHDMNAFSTTELYI
jgi:hypothetical protein